MSDNVQPDAGEQREESTSGLLLSVDPLQGGAQQKLSGDDSDSDKGGLLGVLIGWLFLSLPENRPVGDVRVGISTASTAGLLRLSLVAVASSGPALCHSG